MNFISDSQIAFLRSLEKSSSKEKSPTVGKDENKSPSISTNYMEYDSVSQMPLPHLMFLCEALFPLHMFDGTASQQLCAELHTAIQRVLEEQGIDAGIILGGDPVDGLTILQTQESQIITNSSLNNDEVIDILLVIPDISIGCTDQYLMNTLDGNIKKFYITSRDSPDDHLNADTFVKMNEARDKVDYAVSQLIHDRWKYTVRIALQYSAKQEDGATDKNIPSIPCHIVPTEDPTVWTYAFHQQIHSLAERLTPTARQAYTMIKIFKSEELDVPAIVTLEHARMIFFKVCEHTKASGALELMQLLGLFFHKLLGCLINESIPHNFIPQLNLLTPSPNEDILQTVINNLVNIRNSPITYVIKHYSKVGIQCGIQPQDLFSVIEPVIQNSKNKDINNQNQSMANVIVPAGQQLICCLVANSLDSPPSEVTSIMKRAFSMCELCNKMWRSVPTGLNFTEKGLHLYTAFNYVKPIAAAIRLYEYVLDKYVAYGNELSNLACMYHAYIHMLPPEQRNETIQNTKQLFERGFNTTDQEGKLYESYTDFCTFLCRMNMHSEAMQYLQKEIMKKEKELHVGHSYCMEELNTVDEHLQQEITNSSEKIIRVATGIYTRYLLAQCFLNLGEQSKLQPLLNEMLNLVTQIANTEIKALHFNMVGYIYMDAGLFDDAIQVFQQVLEIAPGNASAEDHLMQCYGLKLSMEA